MTNNRIFKYSQIKNDILTEIKNKKYMPGDKIHSENELKQTYNVSSTTVVKALNELVSEGYLVRRQGEGTFVRRNVTQRQVLYSEEMNVNDQIKNTVETTYTRISKPFHNKKISGKFGVSDKKVILITQIGVINNKIWKIQNRFLLAEKLNKKSRENILKDSSVSEELGYNENLINFPTKIKICSGMFEDALGVIKENFVTFDNKMTIDFNKPLLILKRLIHDRDNNPIEYDINYIDSDILEINIETT